MHIYKLLINESTTGTLHTLPFNTGTSCILPFNYTGTSCVLPLNNKSTNRILSLIYKLLMFIYESLIRLANSLGLITLFWTVTKAIAILLTNSLDRGRVTRTNIKSLIFFLLLCNQVEGTSISLTNLNLFTIKPIPIPTSILSIPVSNPPSPI